MLVFALRNRVHSRVGCEDAGICVGESDSFQGLGGEDAGICVGESVVGDFSPRLSALYF